MSIEKLADSLMEFCPTPNDLIHPNGYRDSGLAVIDAVFSIRARYSSVTAAVGRYASHVGLSVAPLSTHSPSPDQHSISDVLALLGGMAPELAARRIFANEAKSHGRLKAGLVTEVARRLAGVGCLRRDDVAMDNSVEAYAAQKRAWTEVPGLGWVTFEYFRLLCGAETVKPDVMVLRWVERSSGSRLSARDGHATMSALATELASRWQVDRVSLRSLDHTVWRHESGN